jgi:hypothetical protein
VLKTSNLLKMRGAQNAESGQTAPNWNVTGTSPFVRLALPFNGFSVAGERAGRSDSLLNCDHPVQSAGKADAAHMTHSH